MSSLNQLAISTGADRAEQFSPTTGLLRNTAPISSGGQRHRHEDKRHSAGGGSSVFVGSQPIVGFNYGARQYDRVRGIYKLAVSCCVAVGSVGFVLFEFFPTDHFHFRNR